MDNRLIFRHHQSCGAMGGRRRVDESVPTGHGPCPGVAGAREGNPPAARREAGTKAPRRDAGVVEPNCQEKPLAMMRWCPYRKPTQVGG